jgi:hypothetical protein
MKKYLIILLVFLLMVIAFTIGFLIYILFFAQEKEVEDESITYSEELELDTQKEQTYLSKVVDTKGAYWLRGFELYWNSVEEEEGDLDWSLMDERMEEFNKGSIYLVVTIKPFANWDQDSCHGEEYEADYDPGKGGSVKVGKPCDMNAYVDFLERAVERYDGDGENDMPGLTIPVKYWEIMNEPTMQGGVTGGMGEELKFFVGTSEEYLEILKTSYEVIKETDPQAQVVQGGQAGMQDNFVEFWEPVFEGGGGNYFDIANIHSISTDEQREDLYVVKFKKFLEEYGLEDKPIWITEVQIGSLAEKPDTSAKLEDFEVLLAKASVFSLVQGADKLFYISNWTFWDGQNSSADSNQKDEKMELDFDEIKNSSTHKVYLNLVDKINVFDEIVILDEEFTDSSDSYNGAHSEMGQYKFVSESGVVYVLWGEAELPSEISGSITVTDIYGEAQTMDAAELVLSDELVFVEM